MFPVIKGERFVKDANGNILGGHIKEERLLREHPKELSYILGVLCGDGYIAHYHYKRNGKIVSYYVFGIHVADADFAKSVFETLKKLGLSPRINVNRYCKVTVTNKSFYTILSKALLNLEAYVASPLDFVRGFYESEGNLQISKRKDRSSPSIRVRIVNTKKELLELVQKFLREFGIESSIRLHYRARKRLRNGKEINEKGCYVLDIHGGGRVIKFLELIKPCIYRKGLIFLQNQLNHYILRRSFNIRKEVMCYGVPSSAGPVLLPDIPQ